MPSYDVTAESTAPPSAVWALLLDPHGWPAWSPIDALETAQSHGLSADGRDGVGAVRAFRTGRGRHHGADHRTGAGSPTRAWKTRS